MKLTPVLIVNILILLILSSCKKEEITFPVFAGIYNDSLFYHEFNPPWEITLQTDTLKNIKNGTDSIDMDRDGSFDLIVRQRFFLDYTDNYNPGYLKEDNFPYIGLRAKNDFDVAYQWMKVNVGQGYFNSISLVDALPYKTRIDQIKNWCNSSVSYYFGSENGQIWLWGAPPSIFWTFGPWYSMTNTETYVGIRKKANGKYKFGWIKFKVTSRDQFEILSYAMEH
jgi:hypothetical protein